MWLVDTHPVAITPPCGKKVQQRPLVMGANAIGVFSSSAQILRSLEKKRRDSHTEADGRGAKGTVAMTWHRQRHRCYLSSATVARYSPSGEKHTDRRELMWTSLSSTAGSSWVWLRKETAGLMRWPPFSPVGAKGCGCDGFTPSIQRRLHFRRLQETLCGGPGARMTRGH